MKNNAKVIELPLAAAAAIDASAFRAHQVTEAVPKEWRDRAVKAWEYYLEEPIVANAVNAWRSFALGDEVILTSEDEAAQKAVRDLAWRLKLQAFLRDMILQLLVKGECVGFANRGTGGIAKLTCVNPISIEPRYEDGEMHEIRQLREVTPGRYAAAEAGQVLPLDQTIRLKWNAPEFSPRGNSMVVPAFEHIEILRDYRKAERAIAKRWTTPLRLVKVGGVHAGKLINPDQRMIDQVRRELNKLDLKSGLVVPFYVTVETHGAEGQVLDTEKKKQEVKEDILIALGMSKSLVTGDGPNFATAKVSLQKMVVQLKEIKQAAREILDWVFEEWRTQSGSDAEIHYGFSDLDLTSEVDQKKVLIELYDRGLISKRTLQEKMGLSPEIENRERDSEDIVVDRNWSVQDVTQLVALEVLSREKAQALLGVESTPDVGTTPPVDVGSSEENTSDIADFYAGRTGNAAS